MFRAPFILAVPILLMASQSLAWSWKDAVDLAIEKNPTLQAEKEKAEVVELRYDNARALRLPRLSLQVAYQNYQNQTLNVQYRAYIGPRFQWILYQGGKINAGMKRARAIQDQGNLSVREVSIQTHNDLRQAFAQAIYAKNYLELAKRIEKQRKENVKLTEIRYRAGLEYKWVFLSSTVKWERAQLDIIRAEMNQKTSLTDLQKLVGQLPIQSVEEMTDEGFYQDHANYQLDQVLATAKKTPKYLLQERRVDEMQANIDINYADQFPTLGVQADFWAMSMEQEHLFPFWLTTVGLSLPLFEGGRIRRNISVARAQLAQSAFELTQTKLGIESDLQNTFRDYVISQKQLNISQLGLQASKDRSRVVTNQYRSGLTTFLDWERSQDDWVNSEIDMLNAVRSYQINRAKLEENMGVELQ